VKRKNQILIDFCTRSIGIEEAPTRDDDSFFLSKFAREKETLLTAPRGYRWSNSGGFK
jgi:hypothetical protein